VTTLSFNHALAENIAAFSHDLLLYLAKELKLTVSFDASLPYEAVLQKIKSGEIQLSWLCGLLYTLLKDEQNAAISPIAAPIFKGQQSPSYSSYLIINKESKHSSLSDLQGLRLAINEEGSFSGHHILKYCLKDTELKFEIIASGAHANSIDFVTQGKADFAAIDSSLYTYYQKEKPDKLECVRSLMKLADFPAPLLLVHDAIPKEQRQAILRCLLTMPETPEGKLLLAKHGLDSFVPVQDDDYQPIRKAFTEGQNLKLSS